ncbi:hypothetical protein SAMN06265219_104145 [Gracilimonas mengyeensis]|uniref:Uncharacterized protein n=1 Tax=Gracilimonas mengyeensis TaxID=1302730 RepID=A0A521C482_9BACT|nr:hypothetical protein SAMN06265219_104145 [Gracilimonas mengyeensis]
MLISQITLHQKNHSYIAILIKADQALPPTPLTPNAGTAALGDLSSRRDFWSLDNRLEVEFRI